MPPSQVAGALPAQEEGALPSKPSPPNQARAGAQSVAKPTPRALRTLRTKIDAGQRGTDRMLADLRRYTEQQPETRAGISCSRARS